MKQVFTTALLLTVMAPVLAQSQSAATPPPPGPYQTLNVSVPIQSATPQQTVPAPEAPAQSATQIWGQPPVMQVPYWMGRPSTAPGTVPGAAVTQKDTRQSSISPDADPGRRGGGQAPTTQLSPAGQPTAPSTPVPGYGVQITPGFFPGYNARQNGNGQVQMGAGANAGTQGQGGANGGQYAYAAQPYQGYPQGYGQGYYQPAPGYTPYPGQMPMPYWGAPMMGAYPYPGQVNR